MTTATVSRPVSEPARRAISASRWHFLTGWTLAISDLSMLTVSAWAAVYVWYRVEHQVTLGAYLHLWPILPLFLCAYAVFKLYPGVAITPPQEIRRLSQVSVLIYMGVGTATFLLKEGPTYSRAVFLIAMILSLGLVPLGRMTTRRLCSRWSWFGYPAFVFGSAESAENLIRDLCDHPSIGLKPVALIDDQSPRLHDIQGVPVARNADLAVLLAGRRRVAYALVVMNSQDQSAWTNALDERLRSFRRVLIVPDLPEFSTLWVSSVDLGGRLGLEVEQRLLDPKRRGLKRIIELTLLVAASPILALVMATIAILIKLDSPGPAVIRLDRLGENKKIFGQWKFRTMSADGQSVLDHALQTDPALRHEWETTHKMRRDPRITGIGRFLRYTSLDELPQCLNVFVGEMSLVGPRPICEEEIPKYGSTFDLYTQVRPGLTGLWQVSGRCELGYPRRVQLDAYYVRNWSVWLDLYILAKTIEAVLTGRGAY